MTVTVKVNASDDVVWLDRYIQVGREGEVTIYSPTAQEVEHMYLPGEWTKVEITP